MEISNDCGLHNHNRIDGDFVLEFLYRLKQASTLKWLTLCISLNTTKPHRIVVVKEKTFQDSVFTPNFTKRLIYLFNKSTTLER